MLPTDSWHSAHVRPLHTNNTKSTGTANNTDEAEGVKCLIHSCSREREREEKEGWRGEKKKKKEKTKKQAQPSHLPHSPTRIKPAEGAISAGSHGGSGEPLKPITVARASTLD